MSLTEALQMNRHRQHYGEYISPDIRAWVDDMNNYIQLRWETRLYGDVWSQQSMTRFYSRPALDAALLTLHVPIHQGWS